MPKSPSGEKCPAGYIGGAVIVGKITTDEIRDDVADDAKDKVSQTLGMKGERARVTSMTPERHEEISWKPTAKRRSI